MDHRRLALVPPRYGSDVVGGAETLLREAGAGLAARGWQVDVLTTCARDHFTWANEYPPGEHHDGDLRVVRFPVVRDTSGADRARVEGMLARGEKPGLADQEAWLNDGLRVPELFHHLLDTAEQYRAIVVAPYLFWTTLACGLVAPERTIAAPCLHDEPHARLDVFEPLLSGVGGMWMQTEPELDLLASIATPPARVEVVGEGVPVPDGYDPDRFRARHGLGDRRFVLCGGRREGAKGWEELLRGWARAVRRNELELDLVTFGVGDVHAPEDLADRVHDLGFVSEADRDDAMAAADAYVQPSVMESFSRMIMEAWLAGTPVIGNGRGAVVRWHCERSGAGLLYDDDAELEQCLRYVAEAPDDAATLAKPGRDYVLDRYTWPAALDRMESTIERWFPA
ncbi:MAG: glycosyltransferase family 4 protein [Actinobacteria bacterium]|nr:glycosyltransferase family 4 protein [Actinomycetota bacterium]